jgi:hypothetical protein
MRLYETEGTRRGVEEADAERDQADEVRVRLSRCPIART